MHQPFPPDHAGHDLSLIAAHAAGDLPDAERPRVDELISSCTTCANLRRDLVAIAAATRSVPPPFTLARDFRLDEAQATRLRRGSWLRAFLAPFGASHSVLRPVSAAMTSLGVAGLLLAMVIPAAAPAVMPLERDTTQGAYASDVPILAQGHESGTPDGMNAQASGAPGIKADPSGGEGAAAGAGGSPPEAEDADAPAPVVAAPTLSPLMLGSLGLLALGLALFGLRLAARRVR